MEKHILAAIASIAFLSCSNAPADENRFTLRSHENGVMQVAFSSDGKLLASVGREGSGLIWNIGTRKKQLSLKGEGSCFGIAISPDSSKVAMSCTCLFDKTFGNIKKEMPTACAIEWKLPSGDLKGRFSKNESLSNPGLAIAYSPNGKILALGCRNESKGQVLLWDVEKQTLISKLQVAIGPVSSISFSSDSAKVAVGAYGPDNSTRGEVTIWNVETRKKICTLKENMLPTHSVAFSPDGKRVAAGGGHLGGPLEKENKTELMMWDVKTEKESGRFEGHKDPVYCIAFFLMEECWHPEVATYPNLLQN
jgi:WD40 repeat protein